MSLHGRLESSLRTCQIHFTDENRVGDFFVARGDRVGIEQPVSRLGIGGKYDASPRMASGHSKFASGADYDVYELKDFTVTDQDLPWWVRTASFGLRGPKRVIP